MMKLIQANCIRLCKNKLFLGGCGIAFAITYLWTSGIVELLPILQDEPKELMILISGAIIFFFSLMVPIYIGAEYADGVIRNKIISGHKQKTVYFSIYVALLVGVLIMEATWLVAGMIAGVPMDKELCRLLLIMSAYMGAHVSVVTAISFRIKKTVVSLAVCVILFSVCFNGMLFGNLINSFLNAEARDFGLVLYNISPVGQWFSHVCYSFHEVDPGMVTQLVVSLVVVMIAMIAGTMELEQRDLA